MNTMNKAFIDAYQSPRTTQPQPVVPEGEYDSFEYETFVGTSELVSATATVLRIDGGHAEASSNAPHQRPNTKPATPQSVFGMGKTSVGARRPLSTVQAEREGRADATSVEAPASHSRALTGGNIFEPVEPCWPEECQQLLATAADKYDAVLRMLPASSAGLLLGIVGDAVASGCTTTAICLALRSAALGYSTILVDGNLPQPDLACALKCSQYSSWGELLATSQSIATAIQSNGQGDVDLLLTGPNSIAELNAPARFRASLAAGLLRRKYQRVIIDLGQPRASDECLAADLAAAMGVDFLFATTAPTSQADNLASACAVLAKHSLEIAGVLQAA